MKRYLLPLSIALGGVSLHAAAQAPAGQAAPSNSIESLDQRLKVIERKLELQQEATDAQVSLDNRAWQLSGGWVITGEDASYRGVIKPNHPFVPGGEGWGAFEWVARYGELDIDDDAFPLYANAASAATQARSWGLGLNWYLNSNLKFVFNHGRTRFNGGAALGADREDEKYFFTRLQLFY